VRRSVQNEFGVQRDHGRSRLLGLVHTGSVTGTVTDYNGFGGVRLLGLVEQHLGVRGTPNERSTACLAFSRRFPAG
jgi:hypothetical protein